MNGQIVQRDRDADGRFSGPRVDVEQVPRLPTFPARWVLEDPRKRPYLVFWVSDDGDRCHAIQMAPTGQPDSLMVTFDDGATQRLTILRRPLPRGTGTALFYRCNWWQRACRYLYLLTLSRTTTDPKAMERLIEDEIERRFGPEVARQLLQREQKKGPPRDRPKIVGGAISRAFQAAKQPPAPAGAPTITTTLPLRGKRKTSGKTRCQWRKRYCAARRSISRIVASGTPSGLESSRRRTSSVTGSGAPLAFCHTKAAHQASASNLARR
jgi:hypothetical protein